VRRLAAWCVAVALAVAATMAAHALDYRLVEPNPHARALLLAATGHGYEDWLPPALAVLGAAAVSALPAAAIGDSRLRAQRFLVVPPLVFTLQEHLERLLHDGTVPWHAVA